MSLKSGTAHDTRLFNHVAKIAADGSVAAIVELADGVDPETYTDTAGSLYVTVTDLFPYDFSGVKIKAKSVSDRDKAAAKDELKTKNKVPK